MASTVSSKNIVDVLALKSNILGLANRAQFQGEFIQKLRQHIEVAREQVSSQGLVLVQDALAQKLRQRAQMELSIPRVEVAVGGPGSPRSPRRRPAMRGPSLLDQSERGWRGTAFGPVRE